METKQRNSQEILRLIDRLDSDSEPAADLRTELLAAGVNPDRLMLRVRERINSAMSQPDRDAVVFHESRFTWNIMRRLAFATVALSALVIAVSAAMFVGIFYPRGIEAQHQLARAQLISPLLPALSSDDPQRRSMALMIAQQIDPDFASATAQKLAGWDLSQTQEKAIEARTRPYSNRIAAGLQKLQFSQNPDDRKAAIWNDLLPALKEAQQNRDDFFAVAIEYRKVLPLLRVEKPDVFLDSYWGELWILNILLDSRITPVVEAARQSAPKATVVEQIFRQQAPTLSEEKRKAFEEALTVYESRLKTAK